MLSFRQGASYQPPPFSGKPFPSDKPPPFRKEDEIE